jgi:prolyl oligopeptidase
MKNFLFVLILLLFSSTGIAQNKEFNLKDYLWLQELESEDNLKWVEARNTESLDYLNSIEILTKIEAWNKEFNEKHKWNNLTRELSAQQVGNYGQKILGLGKLWARIPFDQLLSNTGRPTIVNIDSLHLPISGDLLFDEVISNPVNYDKCLVFYNRKGRRLLRALTEFNWETKAVVENGFQLPPAQTEVYWRDENSVYVCTNLEKPNEYGYKIRLWKRGESIEEAKVIFETKHYKAGLRLIERSGYLFVVEQKEAFDEIYYYLKDDKLTRLNLVNDVQDLTFVSGQFVVHLRNAWKPANTYFPAGSLISIDFDAFLEGNTDFTLIAESSKSQVIDKIWNTNDILIGRILEDVQSALYEWTFAKNRWHSKRFDNPIGSNISVSEIQKEANRYFIDYQDFFERAAYVRKEDGSILKYSEYKAYTNRDDFDVQQYFAPSKDGTQVPYFVVYKKGLEMNGQNPVIMTGYGGWSNSRLARPIIKYMSWLEDGGVYVLANIRGGGEYGPDWHEAARKSNRQNAYDDFKAVADDLITKKITKAGLIGSTGASNAGLLAANSFIQNPGLFGASVIRSGSIDLELNGTGGGRGIGALGERGDPEVPEEWTYMKKISPLHTLEANKNYPPILQLTSRNDDISDAAQTRKFHQRLKDLGYDDVYLIETAGGGHGYTDLTNDGELELAFFYKNLHPNYEELIKE